MNSKKTTRIMTPKEKAQELYLKMEATIWGFEVHSDKPKAIAIQCAIISVDEILNVEELIEWDFWSDVKQELEKMQEAIQILNNQ